MSVLQTQMENALHGRICFVGVGNVDGGDDGLGVRLAEAIARAGVPEVIIAGTAPERIIGQCAQGGFDHVVFLDAVDFDAKPGSVVFLGSQDMNTRFPQISTHRISLGVLANFLESGRKTRAWLFGVQPASLKASTKLSPAIQVTLAASAELIAGLAGTGTDP